MTVHFGCEACGSPSVAVPPVFSERSAVSCGSCGFRIGTWGDLKHRTRQAILAEGHSSGRDLGALSADPLPLAPPSID